MAVVSTVLSRISPNSETFCLIQQDWELVGWQVQTPMGVPHSFGKNPITLAHESQNEMKMFHS